MLLSYLKGTSLLNYDKTIYSTFKQARDQISWYYIRNHNYLLRVRILTTAGGPKMTLPMKADNEI